MYRCINVVLVLTLCACAALAQTSPVADMQQSVVVLQSQLEGVAAQISGKSAPLLTVVDELSAIRSRINQLCVQVIEFSQKASDAQSQSAVTELLADIDVLLTENRRLQALAEINSPAVVSLDDAVGMPQNRPEEKPIAEPSGPLPYGLSVHGFVAGSGAVTSQETNKDFTCDQAEIGVGRSADDPVAALAEVDYVNLGDNDFDFQVEQAYVSFTVGETHPVTLTLGKFNSPNGWEEVDMPDMYQHTWAMASNFIPSNLVGAMLDIQVTPTVGVAAFVVNGWDINGDNNRGKTFGGRLGYTPTDRIDVGFGVITGPELPGITSSKRTSVDIDYTLTLTERWMLGGEMQNGEESDVLEGGATARWRGGIITNRFTLTNDFGLTCRYDYFSDRDGYLTGTKQKIHSATIAPSFEPITGLRLMIEGKYSYSTRDGFVDSAGLPTDHELNFAFGGSFSL